MKIRNIAVTAGFVSALVLAGYSSVQADSEITAEWECKDAYSSPNATIVRAWVSDAGDGKIEANGIVKEALYTQDGIDHRWDFDPQGWLFKTHYRSAFIIDVDYIGRYYKFLDSEETSEPRLVTKCKKTK